MHILQVISSLDPRGGGPVEGVRQIARTSREWGERTTVLCMDAPGAAFLEGNPFDVVALGPGVLGYGYTPRVVPWLRRHAAQFDAVVVNGLWQYGTLAVWRALRGHAVPYFVFTHGMLDPYFKHAFPLKHLKKLAYWHAIEHRVLRDARAALFTCEEERQLARRMFRRYSAREEVVGYGGAAPEVDEGPARAAFQAAFPDLRGRRLLLFLGRIHPKKGCDLLIEAFAGVAAQDARWRLVLAGPCDAALERSLRALADRLGVANRITWTGMLAGACKWGALYCAEAFVLPSHQENFGIAVTEAMACATPVLISDKVNLWREIQGDQAGLVEPDTLAGTRRLLARWNTLDADARARMRADARACFLKRYEMRQAARRISLAVARLARCAPDRAPRAFIPG